MVFRLFHDLSVTLGGTKQTVRKPDGLLPDETNRCSQDERCLLCSSYYIREQVVLTKNEIVTGRIIL